MIFRWLTSPRIGIPLALAALLGCAWWATSVFRLAQQMEHHAPERMTLREAVAASHDGELYVQITDGQLDCDKGLHGDQLGDMFALRYADGKIPALYRVTRCAPGAAIEGLFIDPPYGLYGAAVERGWPVTPGSLQFVDGTATSKHVWLRFFVGVFIVSVLVLFVMTLLGVDDGQNTVEQRVVRMRALGIALIAMCAGSAYGAQDQVIDGILPVPIFGAIGAAVALAFILLPHAGFVRAATTRLLGP